MQPNQQQNDTPKTTGDQRSGDSPGLPFAVPDYLGLEPIKEAPKKGRIFKRAVLFLTPIFLVAGSGAAALLWWQQSDPEEIFYKALENSMQTKYVDRQLEFKSNNQTSKLSISTDFTNTAQPRSEIKTVSTLGGTPELSINTIINNKNDYTFLLNEYNEAELSRDGVSKGQWYRTDLNSRDQKEVGYWIDDIWSPIILNSVQGIFPMGSLSLEQRNLIIDFIKKQTVYITNVYQKNKINGFEAVAFKIILDSDKLNLLNAELVSILGLSQQHKILKPYPKYQEIIAWVDVGVERFTKVEYRSGKTSEAIDTQIEVVYEYPNAPSIASPTNVKDLTQ